MSEIEPEALMDLLKQDATLFAISILEKKNKSLLLLIIIP